MHEAALLRDLVRKVSEVADASAPSRVRRVRLWVGALSHLTAQHLTEGWGIAAEGTPAADAAIEVVTSTDLADPRAQGVVLLSVDIADARPVDGLKRTGPVGGGGPGDDVPRDTGTNRGDR